MNKLIDPMPVYRFTVEASDSSLFPSDRNVQEIEMLDADTLMLWRPLDRKFVSGWARGCGDYMEALLITLLDGHGKPLHSIIADGVEVVRYLPFRVLDNASDHFVQEGLRLRCRSIASACNEETLTAYACSLPKFHGGEHGRHEMSPFQEVDDA